jgi:hypothetical protein
VGPAAEGVVAMKTLLLTVCLGFAACAVDTPPQEVAAVGVNESALTEDGCPAPRPPMRGCRIPCKPCLIPECVDGQWSYESVEWDGCDSDPLPGSGCCKASRWGGCPAECNCCDYE